MIAEAGPKETALLAAAAEPVPQAAVVQLESDGVVLVYGGAEAIQAARLLEHALDVTVLLTPQAALPSAVDSDFPVARGVVRLARGHLGAFEVTVDDFQSPVVSSSGLLSFGPAREGAHSRCDIILDLSGNRSLFTAAELRDGYVRADPRDAAGTQDAVLKARDLVGTFEKPRYITFTEHLCAHSRSQKTGCTRCLDLCPAGAITPAGDHVAIDPNICAGCGQCAAACPTGAAAYELPPSDVLMRKMRALLIAYREAGGEFPVVLIHDQSHGLPLIEALERFGEGVPANVLPFAVNEVTQVGLETLAAAFVFGAATVRFLLRSRPRHDVSGLTRTIGLAGPVLGGLGFGSGRVATLETDDPDMLGSMLRAIAKMDPAPRPGSFRPMGGEKRGALRFALSELHRAAPAPVEVVPLPAGAPFGAVEVDVAGCTLCLACVSACPTGALTDNQEQPMLRFTEVACIQCGLCKSTCPEAVITLRPRLDFRAAAASARVLKSEEPFCCIRCSKPFGVKSTIERVTAQLAGKHWMFKDSPRRLDLIKMCDDCRVAFMFEDGLDPHATARPAVRTTDDYLRERDELKSAPTGEAEE
jgi:ferredoxin